MHIVRVLVTSVGYVAERNGCTITPVDHFFAFVRNYANRNFAKTRGAIIRTLSFSASNQTPLLSIVDSKLCVRRVCSVLGNCLNNVNKYLASADYEYLVVAVWIFIRGSNSSREWESNFWMISLSRYFCMNSEFLFTLCSVGNYYTWKSVVFHKFLCNQLSTALSKANHY